MAPPLIINRSVNDRCFVREWGGGGWMDVPLPQGCRTRSAVVMEMLL